MDPLPFWEANEAIYRPLNICCTSGSEREAIRNNLLPVQELRNGGIQEPDAQRLTPVLNPPVVRAPALDRFLDICALQLFVQGAFFQADNAVLQLQGI